MVTVMTANIPEELLWIQQLIDRRGVAGTLRLVTVACFERCGDGTWAGKSIDELSQRVMWQKLGTIVGTAAELAGGIEPARFMEG